MRRIKIKVTEEDIADGVPSASTHCPVALALRRRFPKLKETIKFYPTDTCVQIAGNNWRVPKKVSIFGYRFDGAKKVKPFSFVLNYEN